MGSQIRDFSQVTISRESASLTRTGFGTGMIIGANYKWDDRVKTFTQPSDLIDEGLLTSDAIYKAAVKLCSQVRKPSTFKVGRKLEDVNAKEVVTWSEDATGGTFTITVSKEGGASQTTAGIAFGAAAADVKSAMELLTNVSEVTVTLNAGAADVGDAEGFTIEHTTADANTAFTVSVTSSLTGAGGAVTGTVTVEQYGSAVEDWATCYAAVKAADNDFYGVMIISVTAADIEDIAEVVEADTTPRLFYYRTADANNLVDGTGIGYTLETAGYNRSFGVYSTDTDGYAEACAMAIELARDPGSYTMRFQQVSGVTVETLTASNIVALKANKLNFIEAVGGYNIFSSNAVVASGEYSDTIRFVDWLQVRMSEDLFGQMVNVASTTGKSPYTVGGYAIIEAAIRKRLSLGVASGGITPGTVVVTIPHPDDADSADKSARIVRLTNVFQAQLAGAVHETIITGTLYL